MAWTCCRVSAPHAIAAAISAPECHRCPQSYGRGYLGKIYGLLKLIESLNGPETMHVAPIGFHRDDIRLHKHDDLDVFMGLTLIDLVRQVYGQGTG